MKNFFRLDNPVFQFLSTLADMVLVDVLCILFCLPVVTAGASIAATYKVVLDISRDSCGGIWNTFFRAFRENFKQATIVWLITLLIAASLICDFMLIRFFYSGSPVHGFVCHHLYFSLYRGSRSALSLSPDDPVPKHAAGASAQRHDLDHLSVSADPGHAVFPRVAASHGPVLKQLIPVHPSVLACAGLLPWFL
ncbi:MAG: DUF624 domain-containing protein [Oscillospiraceae bacterium]